MRKLVRKYPKLSLAVVTTVVVRVMGDRKVYHNDPYDMSSLSMMPCKGPPRWRRLYSAIDQQASAPSNGGAYGGEDMGRALSAAWKGYTLASYR